MSQSIGPLVLIGLLVFGVLRLVDGALQRTVFRKVEDRQSTRSTTITCPTCHGALTIEGMLDASVSFGPGAIIFDCPNCRDRVYFSPYETFVETGVLAAAPVLNAIPLEEFGYPKNFDMGSSFENDVLTRRIGDRSWRIPRA